MASSVSQHRSCGRAWGALQIWSAYGDPNRPDLEWFGTLLASAQNSIAQQHAAVLIGDFNWKPAYDKSLCDHWCVAPRTKSVKSGTAALIRCICTGATADFAASHDILGVPHHLAMVYVINGFEWQPSTAFRLRRCGKIVWATKPNPYEDARLRASADEGAQKVGYTASLLEAWMTWHARA